MNPSSPDSFTVQTRLGEGAFLGEVFNKEFSMSTDLKDRRETSEYVRFLKRRQRTSLVLERATYGVLTIALLLFACSFIQVRNSEYPNQGILFLALGCVFLAILLILIEAVDAFIEKQRKQKAVKGTTE